MCAHCGHVTVAPPAAAAGACEGERFGPGADESSDAGCIGGFVGCAGG